MNKYFGGWSNYAEMIKDWEGSAWDYQTSTYKHSPVDSMATEDEVLLASYDQPPYEGYGYVLFKRGNDLYEVDGSHCSCNGLEGQWDPKLTSWKELLVRKWTPSGLGEDALAAYKTLINDNVQLT